MLKLPKDVVADPRHDAVLARLSANASPLWERGENRVATLPLADALADELRAALGAEEACFGLELIEERLRAEQKGLDAVKRRAPESPSGQRISRVLFLANDGSVRFYRDADALVRRFEDRLLACRLDVTGDELGLRLTGSPRMMRSILVIDKRAAARALLALV